MNHNDPGRGCCAFVGHGFTSADKEFTAEMVQSATMKFRYPQLWSKLTLPKLERELEGVMNLLIDGLCPHKTALRGAHQEAVA